MFAVVGDLAQDAPCQCTLLVLVPPLLADAVGHGNTTQGIGLDAASLTPPAAIWRERRALVFPFAVCGSRPASKTNARGGSTCAALLANVTCRLAPARTVLFA